MTMPLNEIKTIKAITTSMCLLGAAICVAGLVAGIVLLLVMTDTTEYIMAFLNKGEWDELTGGWEVLGGLAGLGGTLLGLMAGAVLLGLALCMLALFLVPSIHGIALWRSGKSLPETIDAYRKSAKRDSIIKLICAGIPTVLLLQNILANIPSLLVMQDMLVKSYDVPDLILVLYLGIIIGLEIRALYILGKNSEA